MIDKLIRQIMAAKSLSQKDLAELTGSSLSRVKAITSGRVAKLKFEEAEALVKKLYIRGDWLATGQGPMFQSEAEKAFHQKLNSLSSATKDSDLPELDINQRQLLQEFLYYYHTDESEWLARHLITDEEAKLVDDFRHCSPDGKAAIKATIAALIKKDD